MAANPVSNVTTASVDYESMDVNQLRGVLKDRGLNPFGAKAELVKRVIGSQESAEMAVDEVESPAKQTKKRKRK